MQGQGNHLNHITRLIRFPLRSKGKYNQERIRIANAAPPPKWSEKFKINMLKTHERWHCHWQSQSQCKYKRQYNRQFHSSHQHMCLQFCLLFGRCVECCLLCAVDVTKWNRGLKVNSAIWPSALCTPGGERQRQRGRGKAAKDHQGCLHYSFSGSKISPTNCTLCFIGPKSNYCLVNLSKLINGFLCCLWICYSCYMDLFKLLHVYCICQTYPMYFLPFAKLKFEQDFKALWSFCFSELKPNMDVEFETPNIWLLLM